MTPDMTAMGYVGIGLLIGAWLCGASVTSFVWFRVPMWFRGLIGVVISALSVGYFHATALCASSPRASVGPIDTMEFIIFFGTIAAFTLPLLLTGYGYPGLFQRYIRRRSTSLNT
jgi:hypothetical protein